jgi:guanylate kinase
MENFVYPHDSNKEVVVFIHARESKDIARLKEEFNAKSVVVRRKFVEDKKIENHADSEWWMPDYDYTIINNSNLEYLEKTSKQFMDYILQEDWNNNSGEN